MITHLLGRFYVERSTATGQDPSLRLIRVFSEAIMISNLDIVLIKVNVSSFQAICFSHKNHALVTEIKSLRCM